VTTTQPALLVYAPGLADPTRSAFYQNSLDNSGAQLILGLAREHKARIIAYGVPQALQLALRWLGQDGRADYWSLDCSREQTNTHLYHKLRAEYGVNEGQWPAIAILQAGLPVGDCAAIDRRTVKATEHNGILIQHAIQICRLWGVRTLDGMPVDAITRMLINAS